MESHDLLEEVKEVVSRSRVREVRDGCVPRPRDDGDEENTHEDRAAYAVEHKEDRKDTADEDTEPHARVLEHSAGTEPWQAFDKVCEPCRRNCQLSRSMMRVAQSINTDLLLCIRQDLRS